MYRTWVRSPQKPAKDSSTSDLAQEQQRQAKSKVGISMEGHMGMWQLRWPAAMGCTTCPSPSPRSSHADHPAPL